MNDIYRRVMTAAAEQCGLTFEQVVTRNSRGPAKHDITTARFIGWYILNTHHGWSHSQICRHALLFSRPTVRYGINRISEMPHSSTVGELVERTLAAV